MQKTPFQNSLRFSHSFKMFECTSTQENSEIRNIGQFFPWHGLWNLVGFSRSFDILIWNLFWNITWNTAELKNIPGFNTIHCWPKEMDHLGKIPNLPCLQWDLSSFTKSKTRHTLVDFLRYWENHLTFLNGFFCGPFQILVIKYDPAGVTWPWPWVTWEAWIHGAFLLRLSVVIWDSNMVQRTCQVLIVLKL